MTSLREITAYLDAYCPAMLAEAWDNVGLLVGDPEVSVDRVMTCLTVTSTTVDEAVKAKAQLVVTHHPLPFRPIQRLTTATTEGLNLLRLIRAGIAIYSPHTAFDSTVEGINQRLAVKLELGEIVPIMIRPECPPGTGGGRMGTAPPGTTLGTLADRAKGMLGLTRVQIVGDPDSELSRVAVACGSAGEYLPAAAQAGCECLVTGETRFHTCLEAEATGVGLLLLGHYASERFAVEELSGVLTAEFPSLKVWPSSTERDPLAWI